MDLDHKEPLDLLVHQAAWDSLAALDWLDSLDHLDPLEHEEDQVQWDSPDHKERLDSLDHPVELELLELRDLEDHLVSVHTEFHSPSSGAQNPGFRVSPMYYCFKRCVDTSKSRELLSILIKVKITVIDYLIHRASK